MTEVVTRRPPYGRNFACVLSVTTLRDMFRGIVESYSEPLTFRSMWNVVLDGDHDAVYPRAVWAEPLGNGVRQAKSILDTFTLQVRFEQEHSTERTTDVRDTAHSDMDLAARMCFYRFLNLYAFQEATYDGNEINLRLEGGYSIEPFWDSVGTSTTGVILTFTVTDQNAPCVTDDDFPTT